MTPDEVAAYMAWRSNSMRAMTNEELDAMARDQAAGMRNAAHTLSASHYAGMQNMARPWAPEPQDAPAPPTRWARFKALCRQLLTKEKS